MGLLKELGTLARKNVRDYGMYIAFLAVVIYFTFATGGTFLSARNISNLINQEAYIVVMAVAMTMVLIIRQIDLSIGFFAGFMGAVAIVGMKVWGLPVWAAIPIVLVVGALFGLMNGLLVAKIGVPAFVVTLGGQFLFKGLLGYFLNTTTGGTAFTDEKFYLSIGEGFIPGITKVLGMHLLPLILGALCIVMFVYFQIRARRNQMQYGFEVNSMPVFIIKLVLISGIIAYLICSLASYNGFSWTAVIVAVVVFIYNFIMSRTTFGRHVYAVGGNPEAAELSGVNVKKLTIIVFISMSVMSALAGIMLSSQLHSATPQLGMGKELYAIAGAFVGGTSPSGGIGKVTGSVIGAYLMSALGNGMRLMGARTEVQDIVIALVLVVAVVFDIITRRTGAKAAKA